MNADTLHRTTASAPPVDPPEPLIEPPVEPRPGARAVAAGPVPDEPYPTTRTRRTPPSRSRTRAGCRRRPPPFPMP